MSCRQEQQRGRYPGAGPGYDRTGTTTPAGVETFRKGPAAPGSRMGAIAPESGHR